MYTIQHVFCTPPGLARIYPGCVSGSYLLPPASSVPAQTPYSQADM